MHGSSWNIVLLCSVFNFYLILGHLEEKSISKEGKFNQVFAKVGCSEFDPC